MRPLNQVAQIDSKLSNNHGMIQSGIFVTGVCLIGFISSTVD